MAEVGEVRNEEKSHILGPMSDFPRDLLQRFINANNLPLKLEEPRDDAEELELSLGLSLNGRFGVDPRAKKIKRTSSIPEFMSPVRDNDMAYVIPKACTPLMRTCSLHTETEEEWRQRKELQTLRRMEARRKRSEKQRKAVRERSRAFSEEIGEEDKQLERVDGNNQAEQSGLTSFYGGSGLPPPPSLSQGSSGSMRSGSSGISESDSQPAQGVKSVEANSLTESEQKSQPTTGKTANNSSKIDAVTMTNHFNQSKNVVSPENRTKIFRNLLEDMPCVTTKGVGPNGRRIEGFLYRYRKGEEVRIVCVCHGTFLTPAEFVKHAGGGDVEHPLKHIVVSPSFF
ncbi:hypothetical protein L6164_007551 [Bauhinia variegata]|uniref:Uncharacterized protein n=1 Tax=Bauhinia variegata TaxID=167791 RepID=A0ACB9PD68_BAUVA|nr:hypothetical protein L6164_007551 [Bauhinia variegata]